MHRTIGRALVALLFIGWGNCSLHGAEPLADDTVAARVGDISITARVVERQLRAAVDPLPMDPAQLQVLRKAALETAIERVRVLRELEAQGKAASRADVDLAIRRLEKELAARDQTWADHLEKSGLSEAEYRDEVRWRLSWSAYLKEQLTDENLKRYFERHRRQFDGTQLRVAHILLKTADDRPLDALEAQAENIRQEILDGKMSFAEAAAQHSQGGTAAQGGDIGLIGRQGPMPEPFSRAAFSLEPGAISPPVRTSFGIHLITVLEVVPGKRTWEEVRGELRPAVTQYLFDWLASRQSDVAVEYTGKYPDQSQR